MPQPTCVYCGSPIPIGAESCKSCQLSGEMVRTDERMVRREKRKSSQKMLLVLFVVALVVVAVLGVVIYVRLHR